MTDREIHDFAHQFSDWHDKDPLKWEVADESFLAYAQWVRLCFMTWAKIMKLPRDIWERVFQEYMND